MCFGFYHVSNSGQNGIFSPSDKCKYTQPMAVKAEASQALPGQSAGETCLALGPHTVGPIAQLQSFGCSQSCQKYTGHLYPGSSRPASLTPPKHLKPYPLTQPPDSATHLCFPGLQAPTKRHLHHSFLTCRLSFS